MMGSSGLPDETAGAALAETARAAGSAPELVGNRARAAAGGLSLTQAMGLLVAGVVIVGIWQFIYGLRVPETAEPSAASSAALTVVNVDLGSEVTSGIDRLGLLLDGVTDVRSAKDALPVIRDISNHMDTVKGLAERLPGSGQTRLANLSAKAIPPLQTSLDRVFAIPGVADVLRPVLDPLMTTIGGFANKLT